MPSDRVLVDTVFNTSWSIGSTVEASITTQDLRKISGTTHGKRALARE